MTKKKGAALFDALNTLCEMVDHIKTGFFSSKMEDIDNAVKLGANALAKLEGDLAGLSAENAANNAEILAIVRTVNDLLLGVCKDMEAKIRGRILFSKKAVLETSYSLRELRSLFEITADFVKFNDQFAFELFKEKQSGLEELRKNFIANHEARLFEGVCISNGAAIYLNVLAGISNITMQLTRLVFIVPVS
ncbi:MAG: hypothetical protein M0Z41_00100 [Peptococcaceae bacterium]|jgi:Na+/phosphate symporter|nr:hypothetical protein [Peptococcaceae bacterium]